MSTKIAKASHSKRSAFESHALDQERRERQRLYHFSNCPKAEGSGWPGCSTGCGGNGSQGPKSKPVKIEKSKDELSNEQRSVLRALDALGGKDVHSMDIAKKLGFDKKYPKAPRGPVRNAMERLHHLHFVTSKKTGVKYSYSITDKGRALLESKDKEVGSSDPAPASTPSTTEGIECPWCKSRNPAGAEFCKECGRKQPEAVQAAPVAA